MERMTIVENPDGTTVTTVEKTGLVVRDAIFGIVGAGAGIVLGSASIPVLQGALPKVVCGSPFIRKAAVGIGAFTAGEIAERSVVNALTDIADFGDRAKYEMVRRATAMADKVSVSVMNQEEQIPNAVVKSKK